MHIEREEKEKIIQQGRKIRKNDNDISEALLYILEIYSNL